MRIRLHVGTDKLHLRDTRDYILKMPARKKTGPLYINGGGNVEIVGGYMSTKVRGPNINISDDGWFGGSAVKAIIRITIARAGVNTRG